jgi:hypothetical protein
MVPNLLKKYIYSTYPPFLSFTHLWLRCYNFFNPCKKNSFGCAENRKSHWLIRISTYVASPDAYLVDGSSNNSRASEGRTGTEGNAEYSIAKCLVA